ncbi:MAG: tyrosine-type recombinase/integrase, partial [Candidatus Longimicrobiales bacterium M2_2A_002]
TRAIANTPDAIAWQVGTLARISELMFLRWQGIRRGATVPTVDLKRGLLYLPGTKTSSAPRWLVIFDALAPWIERMRRISLSPPDTIGFVFQTPGRNPNRPPSKKTYGRRMAKAQQLAGVKLEGEATHIFRDTAATRLLARMEAPKVKLLLGHKAYTGATSKYANRTRIVKQLAPKIRTYLDGLLPHPTEVFAEATARLQAMGHDVVLDPFPSREE